MSDRAEMPRRLLILGGTAEAVVLARAALERFEDGLAVVTALAGRTQQPGPIPGIVRIGGFGGIDGLASYLRDEAVDLLVDATHPFADQIARHARVAAERVGVPRLILERPPWRRHPLDRWVEVADFAGAAEAVARLGRRCLLAVGASEIDAFAGVRGVHFVVRLIDPPRGRLPLVSCEVVRARGPFALAGERALLRHHRIDVIACKASGGTATQAKLVAARELSVPVVMVRRPQPEPGRRVDSVEAALDWLAERVDAAPAGGVETVPS